MARLLIVNLFGLHSLSAFDDTFNSAIRTPPKFPNCEYCFVESMNGPINYNLSKEEEIAFKELKARVSDEQEDTAENDFKLYRFLKARKFDVNNAEKMLRQHLKFRQEMKLDTLLEEYEVKEPFLSYYPENFLGYDKEGSVVIFLDAGKMDHVGFVKAVKMEDYKRYVLYVLERGQKRMVEQALKTGKPLGITQIGDYQNMPFSMMTNKSVLSIGLEFTRMYEANYPEQLKVGYILNVPKFFSVIYGLMKKILPEETLQKMKIYGKDGWREDLFEVIDPKIWPTYLGGERTDPDGNPNCEKTLIHGKPIPNEYYLKTTDHSFRDQTDVKKYHIKANSVVTIPHEVDIPGSFLEWQFESKAHNIGFGINFKARDNDDPKELVPIERVNAHLQFETGTLMCVEAGTYILVLDNSYSWFRGKHIFMKTYVRQMQQETPVAS